MNRSFFRFHSIHRRRKLNMKRNFQLNHQKWYKKENGALGILNLDIFLQKFHFFCHFIWPDQCVWDDAVSLEFEKKWNFYEKIDKLSQAGGNSHELFFYASKTSHTQNRMKGKRISTWNKWNFSIQWKKTRAGHWTWSHLQFAMFRTIFRFFSPSICLVSLYKNGYFCFRSSIKMTKKWNYWWGFSTARWILNILWTSQDT